MSTVRLVVVVSPSGDVLEPVVVVWLLSITLPSASVVRSDLLFMLEPVDVVGIGFVVWVDVVVEEDICACATPIVMVIAAAATSQVLIM